MIKLNDCIGLGIVSIIRYIGRIEGLRIIKRNF